MTKKHKRAISKSLKKYWKNLDTEEKSLRLKKLSTYHQLCRTAINFYRNRFDEDIGKESYVITENFY